MVTVFDAHDDTLLGRHERPTRQFGSAMEEGVLAADTHLNALAKLDDPVGIDFACVFPREDGRNWTELLRRVQEG